MGRGGGLGVTAAMFTPSMLLAAGVTLVWLLIAREMRPRAIPFLMGGAIAGIALLGITAASGILIPFIEQMRWLSRNYSTVNVMAYGATIGGYRNLLAGPLSLDLIMRVLIVFCLALPAILPVTNLMGWAFSLQKIGEPARRAIIYLLLCSAALVASTYPRPDLMHLAWVAPVAYALGAALFSNRAAEVVAGGSGGCHDVRLDVAAGALSYHAGRNAARHARRRSTGLE